MSAPSTASGAGLLPCPFCGGEAYESARLVHCEDCGATLDGDAPQWNRRALPASRTSAATGWAYGDDEALQMLRGRFTWETTGGVIHPHVDVQPSEGEQAAINYLCAEWDYGYDPEPIASRRLAGEQATGGVGLSAITTKMVARVRERGRLWLTEAMPLVELPITPENDERRARGETLREVAFMVDTLADQLASVAARAHPAPAPSAPGEGGGMSTEELDRLKAWAEGGDVLSGPPLLRLIAAARRAEPAAPAPGGGGVPAGIDEDDLHARFLHARTETPDAPAEPGQGGEGALREEFERWIAHEVPAEQRRQFFEWKNGRYTTGWTQVNWTEYRRAALSTPPADAALRSALEQALGLAHRIENLEAGWIKPHRLSVARQLAEDAAGLGKYIRQSIESAIAFTTAAPADGAAEVEG